MGLIWGDCVQQRDLWGCFVVLVSRREGERSWSSFERRMIMRLAQTHATLESGPAWLRFAHAHQVSQGSDPSSGTHTAVRSFDR